MSTHGFYPGLGCSKRVKSYVVLVWIDDGEHGLTSWFLGSVARTLGVSWLER
jgi:hypothetical protein